MTNLKHTNISTVHMMIQIYDQPKTYKLNQSPILVYYKNITCLDKPFQHVQSCLLMSKKEVSKPSGHEQATLHVEKPCQEKLIDSGLNLIELCLLHVICYYFAYFIIIICFLTVNHYLFFYFHYWLHAYSEVLQQLLF